MSDSIPLGLLDRPSQETQASTNRDRDRPPSLNDQEPPPDYSPPKETTALPLYSRSKSTIVLALFYAALVLAPWVITCLLADRPITGGRYDGFAGNVNKSSYAVVDTPSAFARNERWYQAARTIQTIASVLSLPLTSSICASAAVVYMQRNRRLTMPQLMTLADRGWMGRATYWRLFALQWPQYGSSFLVVALLASLLALIVAPIQSIFVTLETVKTPTEATTVTRLWDLPKEMSRTDERPGSDDNLIVILTRAALTTASTEHMQAQLWPGANISCDSSVYTDPAEDACSKRGLTFNDFAAYPDAFFAQLPNSFHTGLFRQFLPRFNSSARVQPIDASEFPENCDQREGGFFVEYTNTTRWYDTDILQTWGLKACMPDDVQQSPWKGTRDRHDFSEVLYLDITLTNYNVGYESLPRERATYRVTLDTTTGYFELPNYRNGGLAGFLLAKDPLGEECDGRCKDQRQYFFPRNSRKRDPTIDLPAPELQVVTGKGPLLTTAMALFGPGSFMDMRITHPEAYGATTLPDYSRFHAWPVHSNACIDLTPLGQLLPYGSRISRCIDNSQGGQNGSEIHRQVVYWLETFIQGTESLEKAFNVAAYIATKTWLENNPRAEGGVFNYLTVSYDMGADSRIPVISRAGVVVVSVLLGTHLLILLSLGIYAAWSQRWTQKLDSFAMMRLGASISHRVPLLLTHRLDLVHELKEVSGWMGDQMPEGEEVGVLGLGGPVTLKKGRKYASYHGQLESHT